MTELIWSHPANRGRRLATLARSLAWQIWKRLVGKPLDVRYGRGRVRCYPDSENASLVIYFNGLFDPHEMRFFSHYLRKGDNVIDAGANIGLYSLFFADIVGPEGQVLSFEPDEICAGRLRENLDLNGLGNVTVKKVAVSDRAGTVSFSVGEDSAGAFVELRSAGATREVPTVRIADQLDGKDYAAGKMDVEGAEPLALAGAMIERHNPPVWTIELTRRTLKRSGVELEDVIAMLHAKSFDLWRYEPGTRQLIEWTERPRKPGHVGDAIAIARPHLKRVRARLASA